MKIIRNMARCKLCGDIIESRTTHEFRWCSCGAVAVDGGLSYLRRVGRLENMEDLSEVEPDQPKNNRPASPNHK